MQERIRVREVLALPEIVDGDPELVVGGHGLDRTIRWAHVVAGTGAVALLEGGELVLTTGAGWPQDECGLEALARELAGSGCAAVVLELGTFFSAAPPALAEACQEHDVPLVVLHGEVRFVQITQRIHQQVLGAQTLALAARAEVHEMLTELGLNRSPVDYVVERLAETLEAPVVLEDSARRVVAWAGAVTSTPSAGADVGSDAASGADAEWGDPARAEIDPAERPARWAQAHPLARWAQTEGRSFDLPRDWERVPVEAQGRRWGHLTVLPGPAHPAGRRTVLELGAFALALGRLADPDGEPWLQLSSSRMFDVLLGGRYRRRDDLAVQLAAAGLPVQGRVLLGATLRGIGDFGTQGPLEQALLDTALRRAVAPAGRVLLAAENTVTAGIDATMRDGPGGGKERPGIGPAHDRRRAGPMLLALLSFPADDPRVVKTDDARAHLRRTGPRTMDGPAPELATLFARELDRLLPSTVPAAWRAHLGLGAAGSGVRTLITSLERVRATGTLDPITTVGRVSVHQAERQPLAYLVRGFAASPEMQEFTDDVLGPLLAHDAVTGPGHSGDLLRVLSAYVEHPGNRSLAAQHARLSRSVFYQRLSLIEELLEVDLADGSVIATLTVALLAHSGR